MRQPASARQAPGLSAAMQLRAVLGSRWAPLREALTVCALGLVFSAISLGLWVGADIIALVWFANAAAALVIERAPRSRWPLLLVVFGVSTAVVNLLFGDPPGRAAAFGLANSAEAALIALLFGWTARQSYQAVGRLMAGLVAAIALPALVVAPFAAALLWESIGGEYGHLTWRWWAGDLLGALAILPLGLELRRSGWGALAERLRRPLLWLLLLGVLLTVEVAIRYTLYPWTKILTSVLLIGIVERSLGPRLASPLVVVFSSLLLHDAGAGDASVSLASQVEVEGLFGILIAILLPLGFAKVLERNEGLATVLAGKEREARGRAVALERVVRERDVAAEAASIGFWSFRPDGTVEWSPTTYRLFGVDPGRTLTYADFIAVLSPAEARRLDRLWSATLGGRRPVFDHRYRVVVNGRTRWVHARASLSYAPDGALAECVGIVQDITAERSLSEERAARAAAERAERAKSMLLSTVSHELRTPLHAVLGHAELLEQAGEAGKLDLRQRESASEIRRAGQHLKQLVGELLDYGRLQAGRLRLERSPAPLAGLIGSALSGCELLARDRRIRFTAVVADDLVADCDERRIRQVLLNLFDNAIKYSPEGSAVEVSARRQRGGMLRVEVRDRGMGIARKLLPQVFEPFERAEAERLAVEGIGLGLSICRRLVRLHGGEIGVRSVRGRGSTFWFTLPEASQARGGG